MTNSKQRDIDAYISKSIEKEDDPNKKQQVVITCDHVFCTEIHKRNDVGPGDFLNVTLIAFRYAVSTGNAREYEQYEKAAATDGG